MSISFDLREALIDLIYFFSRVLEDCLKSFVTRFLDSKMYMMPFFEPSVRQVRSLSRYMQDIESSGLPRDPIRIDFLHSK